MIVIISSHDLNELETLCDSFLIVNKGKLKFQGSFTELESELGISNLLKVSTDAITDYSLEESLEELKKIVLSVKYEEGNLEVFFQHSLEEIMKIVYRGFIVTDIKLINNSLQQALSG